MTSLKSHLEETKPNQESLRVIQQKRDRGNTFGHESKDPCKTVYYSIPLPTLVIMNLLPISLIKKGESILVVLC